MLVKDINIALDAKILANNLTYFFPFSLLHWTYFKTYFVRAFNTY
jgi:hypothetical protein